MYLSSARGKTNLRSFATIVDSDQPRHLCIFNLVVHYKSEIGDGFKEYPKTFGSDYTDVVADLYLYYKHNFC